MSRIHCSRLWFSIIDYVLAILRRKFFCVRAKFLAKKFFLPIYDKLSTTFEIFRRLQELSKNFLQAAKILKFQNRKNGRSVEITNAKFVEIFFSPFEIVDKKIP